MQIETNLAQVIDITNDRARYDESVKQLLADKQILARILKYTLEEFKDFRIEVTGANNASVYYQNSGEYFDTTSYTGNKAVQNFKTIPGGTRIVGNITIDFPKADDYRDYTENLKVTLYGKYEKDGETKNVKMERSISTIVHTPEKVSTPYFWYDFDRSRSGWRAGILL